MTDRPILFSAPMIRALLDGRKTQTRRVLRMQPPEWATFCEQPSMYNALKQWVPSGLWRWCDGRQDPLRPLRSWPVDDEGQHYCMRLPIAKGDRLWVREAWHAARSLDRTAPRDIPHDADIEYAATARSYAEIGLKGKLRPSMFMPRRMSRLTLYVSDVRVQRLQDISEADAEAEGVECDNDGWRDYLMPQTQCCACAKDSFQTLWNAINGPGAWDDNPWVAAYTFEVRRGHIDMLPARLDEASA